MPVEFDSRTEPDFVPSTPPQQPLPEEAPKQISLMILLAGASFALLVAFVVMLAIFVVQAKRETALQNERGLLIGRCFDNGIGGIGRLIEVRGGDRAMLAFPSGAATLYPFNLIRQTACPDAAQAAQEADNG
jgi:hypothetical protein